MAAVKAKTSIDIEVALIKKDNEYIKDSVERIEVTLKELANVNHQIELLNTKFNNFQTHLCSNLGEHFVRRDDHAWYEAEYEDMMARKLKKKRDIMSFFRESWQTIVTVLSLLTALGVYVTYHH